MAPSGLAAMREHYVARRRKRSRAVDGTSFCLLTELETFCSTFREFQRAINISNSLIAHISHNSATQEAES
jgi:hypothetical protein